MGVAGPFLVMYENEFMDGDGFGSDTLTEEAQTLERARELAREASDQFMSAEIWAKGTVPSGRLERWREGALTG